MSDWLSICDVVREKANQHDYNALSLTERAVYLSDNFNFERENGGLSQFFYNSDCSAAFANSTVLALQAIGAARTAEVLSQAVTLFHQTPDGSHGSTWKEYLAFVDPHNRLREFEQKLPIPNEDVFSLLEAFVVKHEAELKSDTE